MGETFPGELRCSGPLGLGLAAFVGAVFDFFPILFPLLAPGERFPAGGAGLGGQMRIVALRHFPKSTPALPNAKMLNPIDK